MNPPYRCFDCGRQAYIKDHLDNGHVDGCPRKGVIVYDGYIVGASPILHGFQNQLDITRPPELDEFKAVAAVKNIDAALAVERLLGNIQWYLKAKVERHGVVTEEWASLVSR